MSKANPSPTLEGRDKVLITDLLSLRTERQVPHRPDDVQEPDAASKRPNAAGRLDNNSSPDPFLVRSSHDIDTDDTNVVEGSKKRGLRERAIAVTAPSMASTSSTLVRTTSTSGDDSPWTTASKRNKKDQSWMKSYEELRSYKEIHGDCLVPRSHPQNQKLGSWVAEQRKQYRRSIDGKAASSITPERIQLLNELGFSWNAHESAWRRQLEAFEAFREEYGHSHVPLNHDKYPKLGLWTKEQRRHYSLMKQGKPSHMTQDRVDALDRIGFVWDTHDAIFSEHLRELAEYKAENGNCAVPASYPMNSKLASWCQYQRRQYKLFKEGKQGHGYLTRERIKALDKLEFVWNLRQRPSSRAGPFSSTRGPTSSTSGPTSSTSGPISSTSGPPSSTGGSSSSGGPSPSADLSSSSLSPSTTSTSNSFSTKDEAAKDNKRTRRCRS
jgi:Helicase associated domain